MVISLVAGLILAYSVFRLWTGLQLCFLQPGARVPVIVLSAIGLLGFSIGTIVSAYFLYLVAGAKELYVLSPAYAEVRRSTPHIKYKTPLLIWILLGLVLLIASIGIGVAILI